MANLTSIGWTDWTVNTGRGCEHASRGCLRCYSERDDHRWGREFTTLRKRPQGFTDLLKLSRKTAREDGPDRVDKVFVNSMTDTFHSFYEDEYVARLFAVAAVTPNLIYQVLTKRHARARALLNDPEFRREVHDLAALEYDRDGRFDPFRYTPDHLLPVHYDGTAGRRGRDDTDWWPLRNVWLGVSVEDQHWASVRIPVLLETPAARRWISAEPLLGPVDLENLETRGAVIDCLGGDVKDPRDGTVYTGAPATLDQVVIGGESGRVNPADPWDAPDEPREGEPAYARGMRLEWAQSLAAQTRRHGRAVFMKQLGSVQARLLGLKDFKGEDWDAWPAALGHLKIREFPTYERTTQ
jgi:protein gp37